MLDLEVSDLEDDVALWRYMDLAKLVSLLQQESLWLARADTFRDQQEGRFPDEMQRWIEKAYEKFPEDDDSPVKDAVDFQDFLVKNTFISCWHRNFDENMVMWEIYGRDTNAVAIKTTVETLRDRIKSDELAGHSLLMKPVLYQDPSKEKGVLLYEDCFFRKRPHFEYEQEVRISLATYDRRSPSKATPYGYSIPVHLITLVESIYVHPDSTDWYVDAVSALCGKFSLPVKVERGKAGNA
ncbi:MAG: DUF2971 domain-containing protein [Gammaproteobacteria bacterium]|nr:DUF2971 domain-containing protein [Gammaproteobacteria bacterium]